MNSALWSIFCKASGNKSASLELQSLPRGWLVPEERSIQSFRYRAHLQRFGDKSSDLSKKSFRFRSNFKFKTFQNRNPVLKVRVSLGLKLLLSVFFLINIYPSFHLLVVFARDMVTFLANAIANFADMAKHKPKLPNILS